MDKYGEFRHFKILHLSTALFLAIALTLMNLPSASAAGPTVTAVTSSLPDGSYTIGQLVPVQVIFSVVVNVTGTPQLTLSTGSPNKTAVNYSSGSGSNTLTFNYTVAAGNTSPDLDYVNGNPLVVNGGAITDAAANDANLKLPNPGSPGSLGANKNIIIDTTSPTVTINQAAGQADPTNASPINFTVVFSEVTTDFITGDVSLSGTAGATTAIVTGGPTTYNVAVSGMTMNGTVIANIAAGVAHDAAGNANTAAAFLDNTVTYNNTGLSLSWIAPVDDGGIYYVSDQTIQLAVVGSVGITSVVFLRWDYVNLNWIEIARIYNSPYSLNFNTSILLPNYNEIRAYAYDAANNSTFKSIWLYHLHNYFLPSIFH